MTDWIGKIYKKIWPCIWSEDPPGRKGRWPHTRPRRYNSYISIQIVYKCIRMGNPNNGAFNGVNRYE